MYWNTDITLHIPDNGESVELIAPVMEFAVDDMMRDSNLLILDTQRTVNIRTLRCVVIGNQSPLQDKTQAQSCFILVVTEAQTGAHEAEYQRLGVAVVPKSHIATGRGSVRARLV
jgi:hypothetical protein